MINRQELVELLRAAACPDENCNEGVVSHMDAYGEPDCSQCQFCYEREQAIESLQAAEPVGYVTQEFIDGKFNLDHISNTSKGQINRVIPVYTAPPAPASVPDEAFNIIEGIRAELTWSGWRKTSSRDWVMDSLSELLSMLTASPAPEHSGDGNEMVAPDVSELEKAAQKLWRESYSCESDFIQAVVDAFSMLMLSASRRTQSDEQACI